MVIDIFLIDKPEDDSLYESVVEVRKGDETFYHCLIEEKNLAKLKVSYNTWDSVEADVKITSMLSGKRCSIKRPDSTPMHVFWGRGQELLENTRLMDGKVVQVESVVKEEQSIDSIKDP